MTISLASLEKGAELSATRFELSPEWITAYSEAVEDEAILALGNERVPPLALGALAFRAILDRATLPEGTIHVAQELSFAARAKPGRALSATARIATRGERQGWVLMGIELSVEDEQGIPLMDGRATITFPSS